MERVIDLASEKPLVIFTKSSCCMSHSMTALFRDLGANPTVHELDEDPNAKEIEEALRGLGCNPTVPAAFIGGVFVGSVRDLLSSHLDGTLRQNLINAGAI